MQEFALILACYSFKNDAITYFGHNSNSSIFVFPAMKYACLILLSLLSLQLSAQRKSVPAVANSDEQLVFGFFSDYWYGLPDEVDQNLINRGYSINLFYDSPIATSNVSIAFGIGWRQHNLYSNAYPVKDHLIGQGSTSFFLIPSRVGTIPVEYTLNKMSLGYITLPFEFRYRSRSNLKFKVSVGVSGGLLATSFTKYIGTDFLSNPQETAKWKRYGIPNVLPFTYGANFRIGVRQWGIRAYYQLPSVFKKDLGPMVRPISFGLTYNPA